MGKNLNSDLCSLRNDIMANHNLPLILWQTITFSALFITYILYFKTLCSLYCCCDKRRRFCGLLASSQWNQQCTSSLRHKTSTSKAYPHYDMAQRIVSVMFGAHSRNTPQCVGDGTEEGWSADRIKGRKMSWPLLMKEMKGAGRSWRAWRKLNALGFSTVKKKEREWSVREWGTCFSIFFFYKT